MCFIFECPFGAASEVKDIIIGHRQIAVAITWLERLFDICNQYNINYL